MSLKPTAAAAQEGRGPLPLLLPADAAANGQWSRLPASDFPRPEMKELSLSLNKRKGKKGMRAPLDVIQYDSVMNWLSAKDDKPFAIVKEENAEHVITVGKSHLLMGQAVCLTLLEAPPNSAWLALHWYCCTGRLPAPPIWKYFTFHSRFASKFIFTFLKTWMLNMSIYVLNSFYVHLSFSVSPITPLALFLFIFNQLDRRQTDTSDRVLLT